MTAAEADPQADRLYRAEDAALGDRGPDLRRWTEVIAFVERVITAPEWVEAEPSLPLDIAVERRSRSARYAAAHHASATIWIPDGQWTVVTVLHELAHLAAPGTEPHGPRYAAAELDLVRWVLGVDAYAELRAAFDDAGVRYGPAVPGQPSAAASS
jgi:putative metallohydrolase (TIGR04338 family)